MRHVLPFLLAAAMGVSAYAADTVDCARGILEPERLVSANLNLPRYTFGDLDGDSHPDVVITDGFRMFALIDRGGAFEPAAAVVSDSYYYELDVVHDQNRDGLGDLVSRSGARTQVRPGRGDGTFGDKIESQVTSGNPLGHRFSDVDGDGLLDLFLILKNSLAFSTGNADGTFAEAIEVPVSAPINDRPLVGDFDGNGIADVFHYRQITTMGAILTFVFVDEEHHVRQTEVAVTAGVGNVTVLDMNADGRDEVLFTSGDQFLVAESKPTGEIVVTPRSWPGVPGASRVGSVLAGDVTGDGRTDLLFGPTLLQSRSNGFAPAVGIALDGWIQLYDWTGDGVLDLLSGSSSGLTLVPGGPEVATNAPRLHLLQSTGWGMQQADMNRDGLADLVVLSSSAVEVLTRSSASGEFRTSIFYPLQQTDEPENSHATPILDWNGDGYLDIAVVTRDKGAHVLLGTGSSFTAGTRLPITKVIGSGNVDGRPAVFGRNGSSVYAVTLAGGSVTSTLVTVLDGDKEAAVVRGAPNEPAELLISDSGQFHFILRKVGSTWRRFDLPPVGAGPFQAVSGNLDGGGMRDLVLFGSSVAVALADSSGEYREAVLLDSYGGPVYPPAATSAAVADFDGDGLNDIALFGRTGSLLRNLGGGSFEPMFEISTEPFNLAGVMGNFDEDNRPDIAVLAFGLVRIHRNTCKSPGGHVATVVRTDTGLTTAKLAINTFPASVFGGTLEIAHDGYVVHREEVRSPFYSTTWTSGTLPPGLHTFDVTLVNWLGGRWSERHVVRIGEPGRRRSVGR